MAALSRIVASPDLTEQVYQLLLHAICDGDLASGARLTQEELAVAHCCRAYGGHRAAHRANDRR